MPHAVDFFYYGNTGMTRYMRRAVEGNSYFGRPERSELYPVGGLEQGASFNALLADSDEA